MNFKMAKQRLPTKEELIKYNELCSKAFSRMAGSRVDVELEPFPLPEVFITKSYIFKANVEAKDTDSGSVNIPSKVIIKEYIPGIMGTSDDEDITDFEFRKEKAVLDLDIHLNGEGERIRIYPKLYSKDVLECDDDRVIIREFLNEKNLEQIAEEQLKTGGIKWEAAVGTPAISDSLYAIALLHVQSPVISNSLKERNLLKFDVPEEASSVAIAEDRTERFGKYALKLAKELGKELDDEDKLKLTDSFFELDKKYVSRKDLLSIVDGELDVFPHHAMLKRIPDAGGVEVGGFVRDLAIYSSPVFGTLWEKPENMPRKVGETYFNIRNQLESRLRYDSVDFDNDLLDLGILFASFMGNLRKAAAIVHYNEKSGSVSLEKEISKYLVNGLKYIDAFVHLVGKEDSSKAKTIGQILRKYGLETDTYKFSNNSSRNSRRSSLNLLMGLPHHSQKKVSV